MIVKPLSHVLFLTLFLAAPPSSVTAQTLFFQGKTIRFVVGTAPGDLYDLWTRMLSSQVVKHIPGKPDSHVQNMPGAGHMVAANYVYRIAKPDGLTLLGSVLPALYFDQLIGRKEVQFDWSKFSWVGSPVQEEHLLFVRGDSPYKTIGDIRKASESPRCGATGTGSTGYYLPKLFEETLGLRFNIITGYQGGTEVNLAIERGELNCRAFTITAFLADREPFNSWRKTGFVRALVQTAPKRDPRLPDVPTIYEFMEKEKSSEANRRLATVILAPGAFGRPTLAPPGLPPDHIRILRDAYAKALKEPDLVALAKKWGWELEPISGDELQALARKVLDQPPEVIERMRRVLGQ